MSAAQEINNCLQRMFADRKKQQAKNGKSKLTKISKTHNSAKVNERNLTNV